MKKIVSMLLLVFLLVGCSTEAAGAGGLKKYQVEDMIVQSVNTYEDHNKAEVTAFSWEEETEVVDGYTDDLYEVTAQYKFAGKLYNLRLLIYSADKQWKPIRYHNLTTGVQLD